VGLKLPGTIAGLMLAAETAPQREMALSLTSAWVHRFADRVLKREAKVETNLSADRGTIYLDALSQDERSFVSRQRTLFWLAALEGATPGRFGVELAPGQPELIQAAATWVAKEPDLVALRRLMHHEHPAIRDLGCLIAAERVQPRLLEPMIIDLLNSFFDRDKISGAVLAALTGQQTKLLRKKTRHEDVWHTRQMMKIALWSIRDETSDVLGEWERRDDWGPNMLVRKDLPTTTMLLLLLHRGHPMAMEYLLNPRGDEVTFHPEMFDPDKARVRLSGPMAPLTEDELREAARDLGMSEQQMEEALAEQPIEQIEEEPMPLEPVGLRELFERYRWWRLLERFLPEDAPDLWLWADHDLMQFQVDVLRNWYLIRRHDFSPSRRPIQTVEPWRPSEAAPAAESESDAKNEITADTPAGATDP
jgi:hypothetical protein